MTDKEKLDIALCNIVTRSDKCKDCALRHYFDGEYVAYCFFALDCILHDHKDYQKENEE